MLYDADGNIITSDGKRKRYSTMAVWNELLKDVYAPAIRENVNSLRKMMEEARLRDFHKTVDELTK